MKNTLRNIILLVFLAISFNFGLSSCFWRRSGDFKWSTRHHPKFFYHKGNNFGGRRLWVRTPHYGRTLY